ncbi:MAG: hypothetical protein ACLSAP_08375 [Oscillospiraceae bacterium]
MSTEPSKFQRALYTLLIVAAAAGIIYGCFRLVFEISGEMHASDGIQSSQQA